MRYRSIHRSTSLAAALTVLGLLPAWAEAPGVVTDMPVTHSLVATVMGDLGAPELLLDRGADAHDFQLRPSQARAVAQADLVVWMGPELTPWMERPIDSLAEGETLELMKVEGLHLQPYRESQLSRLATGQADNDDHADEHDHHDHDDDHAHEHGHEHEHDHAHDHAHEHDHDHGGHDAHDHAHDHDHGGHDAHDHAHDHGHHHGDVDAHAWMNPRNAAPWLEAIAAALAALDPANAQAYHANAAAGIDRIATLEAEMAEILAPVGDAGLVMYHDAYGYLATAFGLNILGTIALGDAAEPGAARLSAIRASLRGAGAVCVFPEVNHPDAYLALVMEGDDAPRVGAPLDPEGVMMEPGADLYAGLLRAMARSIADCVAGS